MSQAIAADLVAAPQLADFYATRHDAPLWVMNGGLRPVAGRVVPILMSASQDNLDPAAFALSRLASVLALAKSQPTAANLAAADVQLSAAVGGYLADLHRQNPAAPLQFVDPAIRMSPADPSSALSALASAPNLADALTRARAMNPIYLALRADLATLRAQGDPKGEAPLVAANLERTRGLPPDLGPRYFLVNPAAESLWFNEKGAPARQMQVIIGKADNQTPSMIGLIRYIDLNPYWIVPPDITSQTIAPAVLSGGPGYLQSHHFEVFSGWTDEATPVPPESVNWGAVAFGAKIAVRQTPGLDNVMGRVKFMLPNPLGIYLHDTPEKDLFDANVRTDSHGCVRLRDAFDLVQWIFGRTVQPLAPDAPQSRVDISPPIPVYILYLTAQPMGEGVRYFPDLYGRDPALMAALSARRRTQAALSY